MDHHQQYVQPTTACHSILVLNQELPCSTANRMPAIGAAAGLGYGQHMQWLGWTAHYLYMVRSGSPPHARSSAQQHSTTRCFFF